MTELATLILRDAIRSATAKSERNKLQEVRSTRNLKNRKRVQSRNLEKKIKVMKKQHVVILIERLEFLISLPQAPIEYYGIEDSWKATTEELKKKITWLRSEVLSKSR